MNFISSQEDELLSKSPSLSLSLSLSLSIYIYIYLSSKVTFYDEVHLLTTRCVSKDVSFNFYLSLMQYSSAPYQATLSHSLTQSSAPSILYIY